MHVLTRYLLILAAVLVGLAPGLPAQFLINPYRFASAPAGFTANTAVFELANLEYIRRSTSITGIAADGGVCTISLWLNISGSDSAERYIFSAADGAAQRFGFARTTAGFLEIYAVSGAGSVRVSMVTNETSVLAASGWQHIYACIDTSSAAACKIYVNGNDQTTSTKTINAGDIDFFPATWRYSIGASSSTTPTTTLDGALAEFWFSNTYLDDPTKFATAGVPISLGTTGQTPTGSSPDIYLSLSGSGNSWATDSSGNANDFTVTGTLSSTTAP
jgi:hypothetical protein